MGKIRPILKTYGQRLAAFKPNARLYLVSVTLMGVYLGTYQLLFNFFILSLGYDKTFLGSVLTTTSLTALVMAIPMGYVGDRLGRKMSLLAGLGLEAMAIVVLAAWHTAPIIFTMCLLLGTGQALNGVTMGPFLMENSGEEERTYLFSFSSGLMTASAFVGNWVGGLLPTWIASFRSIEPTSAIAYQTAMFVVAFSAAAACSPLVFLSSPKLSAQDRSVFTPFSYLLKNPKTLGRLVLPMLVTSIGAGLVMPFMNVYFRTIHHQSDPAIGALFAWGSLAMGIGLMIAPPLAERFGKIQIVVITQALSIPFLAILGYSPWFAICAGSYLVRLALMNMSSPVYQTYVMEQVEPSTRAMVASLVSMSNNFGWAFSPSISGVIQEKYGFNPVFFLTIVLYSISVLMYWGYFWPRQKPVRPVGKLSGQTRQV